MLYGLSLIRLTISRQRFVQAAMPAIAQSQRPSLPLAGFSIIEAETIEEVIQLVANTPCARARGAIEIRPFWDFSAESDSNRRMTVLIRLDAVAQQTLMFQSSVSPNQPWQLLP